MKKTAYILTAAAVLFSLASCHDKTQGDENKRDSIDSIAPAGPSVDTLLVITMPDNCIWGHMGEDTGMSVLEFITDDGDTLYINKTNDRTGEDGIIQGSIRNYTDRFCITVADDSTNLIKAVNVTELQEIWAENKDGELPNDR
ncbi:MAG: hypothetical protein IJQ05_02475 [Bacteroidaceae bacterium]|jgi:hypothetical protein|nr:hypothetical protein [Bacteroidaceae bacterium]